MTKKLLLYLISVIVVINTTTDCFANEFYNCVEKKSNGFVYDDYLRDYNFSKVRAESSGMSVNKENRLIIITSKNVEDRYACIESSLN